MKNILNEWPCTNRDIISVTMPWNFHFHETLAEVSKQWSCVLIRAIVDQSKCLNAPCQITVYDFEQYFHSLCLNESLWALLEVGINDEN